MSRASTVCRRVVVSLVVVGLQAGSAGAAELQVVSMSPLRNTAAAPGATVSVTFDRALQTGSLTSGSLRVFGRVSGTASGPLAFSNGDKTVTLTPSHPFAAGEVVLVNLSHDIVAADTSPLRSAGFAFQFRIQTQPAGLSFETIAVMSNRSSPGVQTRIYGAMTADLNHDGYADLTTVNEVSADLRVFMNKADGTGLYHPFLTPPLAIGVESSPNEPADFNNDGNTDIGVSSTDDQSEWIALGNGDGTYATPQEVPVGFEPHGLAVLDVDGDGDLDIVNANHGDDNLSIMLNNGSGVFGPSSTFDSGLSGEYALNSGDMNNDGIVDLVVGARDDNKVVVLLGNGDGTFTASTPQNCGGLAWKLVVGDVNGDGNLDVAIGNGESNTGGILLGNGDGTLQAPQIVSAPDQVVGSALGDLDGDGDLDWVLSSFGGGKWTLFTNDGTGSFSFNQEFDAPNNPSCAIIVDIDNDGDLDLVLTDEIADKVLLLKNGAPSACPPAPQACRTPTVSGKALLKMKDGMPDDKDLVIWKWLRGAATTPGEFGDPVATDDYTLCLYDNGAFVTSAVAPHGGKWSNDGDGFSYRDGTRLPEGVQKLGLQAGGDGDARILFKGKGVNLRMPDLTALGGPIDVQLIKSSGGVCWGARYSAPFLSDGGGKFKDKAD
jgi:hypothetical protein